MMNKFFFILLIITLAACQTGSREGEQNGDHDTTIKEERQKMPGGERNDLGFQEYQNKQYNFQISYPQSWRVIENDVGNQFPVINIFNSKYDQILDLPVNVHADAEASFISIFPRGYGTELPSGQSKSLSQGSVSFASSINLNQEESILFSLKNGDTWGYYLIPENTPATWKNGFIFAQVSTQNFTAICYDEQSGEKIAMAECDPMTGDKIVREGEVDQESLAEITAVLESIEFTSEENEKPEITELIEIEKPLPNNEISSPLNIKGRARGMWYFEGDFPVELVDKDGKKLAEAIATAQGPWMTEDFVPFTATIQYDNPPDDERGYLVFHRSNASGLPQHDMKYRQPVIFPPQ